MVVRKDLVPGLVLFQDFTCDGHFVDFGRAIGECDMEGIDHPVCKGHFRADTQGSVQLECARGDVVQHFRHRRLHRGDMLAHGPVVVALIDQPGSLQHHQSKLAQLDPGIGDLLLDHLLLGQLFAFGGSR